ncbi:hypothetical protein C4F40_16510 [Sphingobacterium sp. Ka21]|uniref:Bacteriocin n=2 Tax=Sphingobacterium pedocola TaxID=2082722 RepID=A0ABR9TB84_9SPHI|nr:hypothetical protein [Sphingobacterium pedocola]
MNEGNVMSALSLANVAALADGENGGGVNCSNSCSGAYCGTFIPPSGPGVKLYYC